MLSFALYVCMYVCVSVWVIMKECVHRAKNYKVRLTLCMYIYFRIRRETFPTV